MWQGPMKDYDGIVHQAMDLVDSAEQENFLTRLLGAVAIHIHCPRYLSLAHRMGRTLSDIDLAVYRRDSLKLERLLANRGFNQNQRVRFLFGDRRMVFEGMSGFPRVDVFIDKLEMNHDIPFSGRLELSKPTLPLADLLLEKLQIVNLTQKDIIDTIILLREHSIGFDSSQQDVIDVGYISSLLSDDWGFTYTVTTNLSKIKHELGRYDLSDEDRTDVAEKIDRLLSLVNTAPKSMKWKIRARIGTMRKWYRDVEDLTR